MAMEVEWPHSPLCDLMMDSKLDDKYGAEKIPRHVAAVETGSVSHKLAL